MKNIAFILLLCFALPALAQGQGGSGGNGSGGDSQGHDHDRARAAVMRQEAKPLAAILPKIQQQYQAHMVEVRLEHERGILVYKFVLITPDGRIIDVVANAVNGNILRDDAGHGDLAPPKE